MGNIGSETQLTRLVNLDSLIQQNAVLLAMTKTTIGTNVPEDVLDVAELLRYTELAAYQCRLMSERSVLRSILVGDPVSESKPALFAVA